MHSSRVNATSAGSSLVYTVGVRKGTERRRIRRKSQFSRVLGVLVLMPPCQKKHGGGAKIVFDDCCVAKCLNRDDTLSISSSTNEFPEFKKVFTEKFELRTEVETGTEMTD